MFKREVPNCLCPRCKSANTIRTDYTLDREHCHCYDCHRSFEVTLHADPPKRQRRASDRPRNSARSAHSDRDQRSAKVITQSVDIARQDTSPGLPNETDW